MVQTAMVTLATIAIRQITLFLVIIVGFLILYR
jgi:hypothetical protein